MRWATSLLLFIAGNAMQVDISPAYVPIEQLFAESELVAVGRCLSVVDLNPPQTLDAGRPLPPSNYLATYAIARTYKGSGATGKVDVGFPNMRPEWGPPPCVVTGGGFYLLFLRHSDLKPFYALTDSHFGIRPFVPSTADVGSARGGIDGLQADYAAIAAHSSAAEATREALLALADFEKLMPSTLDVLSSLSRRPDPDISILCLEMLARARPAEYLEPLANAMANTHASPNPMVLVRLCEVLGNPTRPEETPALERIVDLPLRPTLRQCAMQGVRKEKAANSVSFLVRHLNDSDADVSYLAVITLAEITDKGGDFGPGAPLFLKNPERYRKLWLDWWEQTGSRQYGQPSR